ncbi:MULTISPECIES: VOC family protein [Pandoraea]|uniref:Drug:proton antiporter n=5 Tax=Pandoraea TaxID=93217 RepID=A0A5E4XXT3_9BURK|nr:MULTISPECIES: VOC family protein [Pandoraea]AJC18719.1 drug:proton antiporter [Pandoraea sputorum]AKC71705.1 drug:proton antiporter [Pandoraea oxalativorans]MCE4060732.1 VOC family protein [Pandoraea sputorum]UVA78338.1 VOC family protein [Pandoraea commovens]SNU82579.1 Predicted enzyme related to lactoylglutathione lyase [Pandoraea sputorum]
MLHPDMVNLYVASPPESAGFYAELFGMEPVEASPGFALFTLPTGMKLGLWARYSVAPTVIAPPGGSEVVFPVQSKAHVDATWEDWSARGITILQAPTDMDFGRTFVASDPDGHRLRVYKLSDER